MIENPIVLENFSVSVILMKLSKCWKIVKFPKFSFKLKNFKTYFEAQTVSPLYANYQASHQIKASYISETNYQASHQIKAFYISETNYQASHQIKASYTSETNILLRRYTGIYSHLLSKCFEIAVLGCSKIVKCKWFFWHQSGICLLENL